MKNSKRSFTISGGLPIRSGLKSGKDLEICNACLDACVLDAEAPPDCQANCCKDSEGCDKDLKKCYNSGILSKKPYYM